MERQPSPWFDQHIPQLSSSQSGQHKGTTHYVGDDCPGGHSKQAEKGFKFDAEKLRYDLVPPYPLEELARVYTDGAKKYGDVNYLKGMAWSRVIAALMRHVEAFRAGESVDPESGHPHLAHAAWQCFTLMEYARRGLGTDNRLLKEENNDPETE